MRFISCLDVVEGDRMNSCSIVFLSGWPRHPVACYLLRGRRVLVLLGVAVGDEGRRQGNDIGATVGGRLPPRSPFAKDRVWTFTKCRLAEIIVSILPVVLIKRSGDERS